MARLTIDYFSEALGRATACSLVLPDDWTTTDRPWPVLYLLHGLGDDHSTWTRRTAIERHVEAHRMLVVMPEGGRGFYTDARQPESAAWESHLLDCIDRIDALFPTVRERGGRAIGGLSMGGYGAVKTAFRHPDRFASVHSHSGALDMRSRIEGEWVASYWARDEAPLVFGDDLPAEHDPLRLAERVDPRPALRLDCGDDDFLLPANLRFRDHLLAIGFPHEFHQAPGLHDWAYWDRVVPDALAFHARHFEAAGFGAADTGAEPRD